MASAYESRAHRDGTHYVVEAQSGHLAHVERDGELFAARDLTETDAREIATALSEPPEETS